jgi:putative PIN family toxin of toxin-antitoxin system
MIVTLDTGILVRATFRSSGPARRLLQKLAEDPLHTLALSSFIIGEVGKVLSYPRMNALLHVSSEEIADHVTHLARVSRLVDVVAGRPVVLTDPNDDPVVYTAIGAGADVLCTRDRDFYLPNVIEFCAKYGVAIMDDVELLKRLGG